ncbi:hypothetical protein PIB30_022371 [Stylosanthes scabra]|uniref:Uncharacterized protein n=1 Tax=Stylosanthes scabra TaxID=79078 RepID=A0ABU6X6J8_9FABA|nr:hypothetical protein [Stylosanthes scabra]
MSRMTSFTIHEAEIFLKAYDNRIAKKEKTTPMAHLAQTTLVSSTTGLLHEEAKMGDLVVEVVAPRAFLIAPSTHQDSTWFADSGASHHVTAEHANLMQHSDSSQTPEQL